MEWAALDQDPERDRESRLSGMSLVWLLLLLSFVLAAGGPALCVIGPASARPGDDTYGMVALIMASAWSPGSPDSSAPSRRWRTGAGCCAS